MSWLVLLLIFWKPAYYLVRYLYSKLVSKDDTHSYYMEQVRVWGMKLLELVKP